MESEHSTLFSGELLLSLVVYESIRMMVTVAHRSSRRMRALRQVQQTESSYIRRSKKDIFNTLSLFFFFFLWLSVFGMLPTGTNQQNHSRTRPPIHHSYARVVLSRLKAVSSEARCCTVLETYQERERGFDVKRAGMRDGCSRRNSSHGYIS